MNLISCTPNQDVLYQILLLFRLMVLLSQSYHLVVKTLDKIPAGYKIGYKFVCKGGSIANQPEDFWNAGVLLSNAIVNVKDSPGVLNAIEIGLYESYTEDDVTTWNRIDYETIPVLRDEANLISDLTNDSYAITCDEFGQPINEKEEAKTTFKLYYGLNEVAAEKISTYIYSNGELSEIGSTDSTATFEADSFKVHANVNGDITVTEFDESTPLATNLVIMGTVHIDGNKLSSSSTFTITKVRPGGRAPYMYQIVPSASIIRRDEEGNKTPEEITLSLVQTVEDKTEVLTALPEKISMNIYEDGVLKNTIKPGTNISNQSIYTKDIQENVQVHLCNEELGVIHDLYIPLIADGESAQLYYLNASPTAIKIDQDGNYSDTTVYPQVIKVRGAQMNTIETIPTGYKLQYSIDNSDDWTSITNISDGFVIARKNGDKWEGAKELIQIQLIQTVDGTDEVINRFDIPVVTDGERGEITKAYSIKASTGVIKVTDKGYEPASVYATVLCRSGEDVNVLEDASADYPLFAVYNMGGSKLYIGGGSFDENNPDMSKKLTSYDTNISTSKSGCVAIEYYLYKKTDDGYLLIDMESIPYLVDGENAPVANLTNDSLAIVCDSEGKVEESFTGTTTFELYLGTKLQELNNLQVSCAETVYSITSSTSTGVVTVTVAKGKVIPDSTDVLITGTCNVKGINISMTKTLKINKLIIGMPGKDGKSGMVIYPAGNWDSSTTYVQETDSTGKPSAAPYVAHGDKTVSGRTYPRYWVLNTPVSTGQRPDLNSTGDDAVWIEMEHFEAVYAEILLSPNALVGSAVFSGDYMFSQNGVGNYKDFDFGTTDPYSSSSSFKPNYCVNLKTGKVWMNGGLTIFEPDGSGQLAGGAISWNKGGGLAINNAGAHFNIDGSGDLANGNFRWDEYGRMYKRSQEFIEWRKVSDISSGGEIQFNKGSYLDFSGNGLSSTTLTSTTGVVAAKVSGSYNLGTPPDPEWTFHLSSRNMMIGQPYLIGDFYIRTEDGWSRAYMITLHWNSFEPIEMTWNSNKGAWMVSNSTYFATHQGIYVMNPPYAPGPNDKIRYVTKMPDVPESGILYILWTYEEDDENDQNG